MHSSAKSAHRVMRRRPRLTFAPLAWLKLQYFCHAGDTEVGGFGVTSGSDLLYVEEFVTVKQQTSAWTVAFDDGAVADFTDRCVDAGLDPQNCLRIWCHTHPGSSPDPSGTDEATFARVFGSCAWAVMFIVSRTANTFARLSFHVGPGADANLPVAVDWAAWAELLADPKFSLERHVADWRAEFSANIQRRPMVLPSLTAPPNHASATGSAWEPFAPGWKWSDLDQELWEEYERHARIFDDNLRT
jgi:proteasome lid subunit RPN8/RPN11